MTERKKRIFDLVLFSILTALCYLGTFIMIPLPTGAKIHLGNLICIISALLLGGVKGGLIGSLGMGLNDLHWYLDTPSTIIRTLVLKFFMGLIAGSIFKLLRKKNINNLSLTSFLYGMSLFFKAVFIISLILFMKGEINFEGIIIKIHVLVPICIFIFSELFTIAAIFMKNKKIIYNQLLIAVSIATIFNILGEFFTRLFLSMVIDRYGFMPSLVSSLSKIPASIFTGIITTIFAVMIFPPLETALKFKFSDVLSEH